MQNVEQEKKLDNLECVSLWQFGLLQKEGFIAIIF